MKQKIQFFCFLIFVYITKTHQKGSRFQKIWDCSLQSVIMINIFPHLKTTENIRYLINLVLFVNHIYGKVIQLLLTIHNIFFLHQPEQEQTMLTQCLFSGS